MHCKTLVVCWLAGLLSVVLGCQPDGAQTMQNDGNMPQRKGKPIPTAELGKALVGKWSNIYMRVDVNEPAEGQPGVVEADEGNWVEKLKIKPIVTVYRENGTYGSEYRNPEDEVVFSSSGKWKVVGDTLFAEQTHPREATYKYHLAINTDNTAEFRCMLDWSQNGKEDDAYFGIQRKRE